MDGLPIDPSFIGTTAMFGAGMKIVLLVVILLATVAIFRWMDRKDEDSWINEAKAKGDYLAVSLFCSVRIAAVCWVIGAVVSW